VQHIALPKDACVGVDAAMRAYLRHRHGNDTHDRAGDLQATELARLTEQTSSVRLAWRFGVFPVVVITPR